MDCKHQNRTEKKYPFPAKCKDCGKMICPDCDGTGQGYWSFCDVCNGKGTIDFDDNGILIRRKGE